METRLEARDLINAQIALVPESDRWSAVLWGTNITDEEYIAGIQNNATLYSCRAARAVRATSQVQLLTMFSRWGIHKPCAGIPRQTHRSP